MNRFHQTLRVLRFLVGVAALAFLVGRGGLAEADTIVVHLKNNFFSPSDVSVATGDTVCWMWDEGVHTTTSVDGLWDSGIQSAGSMFEYTFGNAGDYVYICMLHINCCNMAGVIHVVDPVKLQATLNATNVDPNASGSAGFEMRPYRSVFNVTVAGVSSTNVVDVLVNGSRVGTIPLDASGGGALMLNSQNGDTVPNLQQGDEVEVFDAVDGTTLILVGTLGSGG